MSEVGQGLPVLVCFYSGGFTREEGLKTLEALQRTLRKAGVKDQLVLDHSNEYGFVEEGYEPWPRYVDKLVELIDRDYAGRPVIVLGHSKGTCPAMGVAHRLGRRVLKTYVVACGAWLPGRKTPWEKLSERFKRKGDQELLAWFASLNPGNLLLETVAYAPEDQFEELVQGSAFLQSKLVLMRLQYRDAIYPDMSRGVIDEFPAELCAVSPLWDGGSQPFDMLGFRKFSKTFEMWEIRAGHADVLTSPDFLGRLSEDVLSFFGAAPRPRPARRAEPEAEPGYLFAMPRAAPAPAPAPPPGPRLTLADLREIGAALGASPEAARLLPAPGAAAAAAAGGRAGAAGAASAYTLRVELAPAPGAGRRAGEAAVEAVTVDPELGPLVEQPGGAAPLRAPSFVRLGDGAPQYAPAEPAWGRMQSTDRKVLVEMAARLNRQLRARESARGGRGAGDELPDFLRAFAPRSREDEAHFWRHFHAKEGRQEG